VPQAVAQRAHAQQQAGHHQRVDVDDPELGRSRHAQLVREPRQRGVKHCHVDHDQQQGAGHDGQHQPAAGGGRGGGSGIGEGRIALRHAFTPVAHGIFHLDIKNKKFESIYKID